MFSLQDVPVVADIRGYGMFARDRRCTPTARPGKRGQLFQKKLFDNGLNLKTTGDSRDHRAAADRREDARRQIADILRRTLKAL